MDRDQHIFEMICNLAVSKHPCDICTYSGPVYLDATFGAKFICALQYGAGAKAMQPLLSNLEISTPSGDANVSLADIWIIAPMPKDGFTKEQIESVDLALGDRLAGDSGKTIKEIVKETYQPGTAKELEYFLRRFLAS